MPSPTPSTIDIDNPANADIEELTRLIDETRITYPEREHGVTVRGSPFTCDFEEPVDPERLCETITTAEDPWRMFGLSSPLADDYWKVVGNLFHIEDGEPVDSSKIAFEVAPEWIRIYVKNECSAERVAEFVQTLDTEYQVTARFVEPE